MITRHLLLLCLFFACAFSAPPRKPPTEYRWSFGLDPEAKTIYVTKGNFRIPYGQTPRWYLQGVEDPDISFMKIRHDDEKKILYIDNTEIPFQHQKPMDWKYLKPVYLIFPPVGNGDHLFQVSYVREFGKVQRVDEDELSRPKRKKVNQNPDNQPPPIEGWMQPRCDDPHNDNHPISQDEQGRVGYHGKLTVYDEKSAERQAYLPAADDVPRLPWYPPPADDVRRGDYYPPLQQGRLGYNDQDSLHRQTDPGYDAYPPQADDASRYGVYSPIRRERGVPSVEVPRFPGEGASRQYYAEASTRDDREERERKGKGKKWQ